MRWWCWCDISIGFCAVLYVFQARALSIVISRTFCANPNREDDEDKKYSYYYLSSSETVLKCVVLISFPDVDESVRAGVRGKSVRSSAQ